MSLTGFQGWGGFAQSLVGGSGTFTPLNVPQVVAGVWWDPEFFTGLGTAAFRWTEQNGRTEYDALQTVVARQPSQITTRSYKQWALTNTAGSAMVTVSTAGPMGWTGASMVACWVQFPLNTTGTNQLLRQNMSGTNRRMDANIIVGAGPNRFQVTADGVSLVQWRWGTLSGSQSAAWRYIECLFYPSNRLEFWIDRQIQTIITQSPAVPATLNDPASCAISFACTNSTTANVDNTNLGMCYYTNGIPTDNDRNLLYLYKAPAP